jgi:hypothetical protein
MHGSVLYKRVAAAHLARLAERCPQTRRDIVHHQGIVPFVVLLRDVSDKVCVEHAAWALANLAVDQETEVAAVGAIPALIDVVKNGSDVAKVSAAEALQKISRLEPAHMSNSGEVSMASCDSVISIAMTVGFGALLQLAQSNCDTCVMVGSRVVVYFPWCRSYIKRKAALILRRLQGTVPEEIAVAVAAYLPLAVIYKKQGSP